MLASTTKKGKHMELLFITLAIATVATLGQLVDATGGRFGQNGR